tara:strand:+ start:189 stop:368 length:180 start_codon:yes stop_codon:yes gene_type:complete
VVVAVEVTQIMTVETVDQAEEHLVLEQQELETHHQQVHHKDKTELQDHHKVVEAAVQVA